MTQCECMHDAFCTTTTTTTANESSHISIFLDNRTEENREVRGMASASRLVFSSFEDVSYGSTYMLYLFRKPRFVRRAKLLVGSFELYLLCAITIRVCAYEIKREYLDRRYKKNKNNESDIFYEN